MDVIVEHQSLTHTSSGSVTGKIWLRSNHEPRIEFPEAGWIDFPVVVLGWWLAQVEALLRRASVEAHCSFMDGPFEFRIDDKGQIRLMERTTLGTREIAASQVALQEFWQQLNVAASRLVAVCAQRGWSDADIENLRGVIAER